MNEVMNSASVLYSRTTVQPFAVAVTLFGALVAGTGGVYSQANAALVSEWTNVPAVTINSRLSTNRKKPAQAISIPKAILQIRDRLGLKMSELAEIFGVSRQAVYLWLKGENLKNEYVQKIWQLSVVAEQMEVAGIDRPERFIHRPISADGLSLFQILLTGENADAALSFLKAQSTAEQHMRENNFAELQNMRTGKSHASSVMELSTPILDEYNG
jgi:transcriptional regulator with XRE-family HTH domain